MYEVVDGVPAPLSWTVLLAAQQHQLRQWLSSSSHNISPSPSIQHAGRQGGRPAGGNIWDWELLGGGG